MPEARSDIGSVVRDRFRISRLITEDTLGWRYAARDQETHKQVTVLLVRERWMAAGGERFDAAGERLAALEHPHVVPVIAHGRHDGRGLRVTPWTGGQSLQTALAEPLLHSTVTRWAGDVARALTVAHAAGLVHGGLCPAAIRLVRRTEPPDLARVDDFGLAALLDGSDADASGLLQVGGAAWTAPETAMGAGRTERSDLYALGAILFHGLTGRPPFIGPSMKVLAAHVGEPASAPSAFANGIPLGLDELVLALLEKDPANRPASASEVVAWLDREAATLGDAAAHPDRVTANVAPMRLPNVAVRGAGSVALPEYERAPTPAPPPALGWGAVALLAAGAVCVAIGAVALVGWALY